MLNELILEHLYQVTEEEKSFLLGGSYDKSIFNDDDPELVDYRKIMRQHDTIQARMHSRFAPYPKHRHNFIEMVYMCRGKTTHIINGKQPIELREGNILFINQHAYHSVEKTEFNDLALNLFMMPEILENAANSVDKSSPIYNFLWSCLQDKSCRSPVLLFNVNDVIPVQNLMENILWYIFSSMPNRLMMIKESFKILLMELQNHVGSLLTLTPEGYDQMIVIKVLDYIEKNYVNGSLNEIADRLNQPVYQLSRRIHEYTNSTFSDLLKSTRLDKAEKLLKETDMCITDIINSVGYNNITYFYKYFKAKTGFTPKAYRENKRKNSL